MFFPAETSDQAAPPQWFFDQSPSQVKAAFLAKRKKTELDQVSQNQPSITPVDDVVTDLQNLLHNAKQILSGEDNCLAGYAQHCAVANAQARLSSAVMGRALPSIS